ncbi:MAG TPA: hypothetical protein VGI39_22030 [Polyangiaceae bacterium]|jgi:predicted methyltransferase
MQLRLFISPLSMAFSLALGCASSPRAPVQLTFAAASVDSATTAARVAEILATHDRAPDDRALDGPRHAADVLTFLDVSPGMFVAELASGSGYFTELLARSVGSSGLVFAENPPSLLARQGLVDAWSQRLGRPPAARIVRLDSELPVPLAVRGLDLIYLGIDYGALRATGIDARAVDAGAWNALRAGGRYVVIDRSPDGAARAEVEGFGFRFVGERRFLHGAPSPSDWRELAPSPSPSPPTPGLEAPEEPVLLTFARP